MASKVILPRLGMNMELAKIVRWHKREGDTVAVGEILAEIETDKVTMELEAETAGVVRRLLAQDGDTVEVFGPVAVIGDADEDISGLLDELATPKQDEPSHVDRV